jgi:hypothetical protein
MSAEVMKTPTAAMGEQLDINNPDSYPAFAKRIKDFIVANKLSSNIKGKEFVKVEGWQFVFTLAGLRFIASKPQRRWNNIVEFEITYEAECHVYNKEREVMGYGFAVCSNMEAAHSQYEEYALASYAQTRAISKAGRNLFAYIMALAGYEPTPYEEMMGVEANDKKAKEAAGVRDVPAPGAAAARRPAPPAPKAIGNEAPQAVPDIQAPVMAVNRDEGPAISGEAVQLPAGNPSVNAAPAIADVPAEDNSAITDAVIETEETAPPAVTEEPASATPPPPKKRASGKKTPPPAPATAPVTEPEEETVPVTEKQELTDEIMNNILNAIPEYGQVAHENIEERLPNYNATEEQVEQIRAKLLEHGFELKFTL